MTSVPDNSPAVPDMSEEDMGKFVAEVKASATRRENERAERRARFAKEEPEPKLCIVAWVDLLGFAEQIRYADTLEKFQIAYQRVREVHEEFDNPRASVNPDQAEWNESAGKCVTALSDGLVISLNLEGDCPAAKAFSNYERVVSFLEDLRMAQARCASVGNFLRGGVAVGYFWFKDDILLSPALVEAYEMESKKSLAQNPVIILSRNFADALRAEGDNEGPMDDSDPMIDFFRECEWMEEPEKAKHVMLNFMPVFLYDDNPERWLHRYHRQLIDGRKAAPEKAKPKYDWLIKYAREFVASEIPSLEESVFGAQNLTSDAP